LTQGVGIGVGGGVVGVGVGVFVGTAVGATNRQFPARQKKLSPALPQAVPLDVGVVVELQL